MGWTHAGCDVGGMSDFADILRKLQQKYPGKSMPEGVHWWRGIDQLQALADTQHRSVTNIKQEPENRPNVVDAPAISAIKADLEDETEVSDVDSQATQVYEPVLGPPTPVQQRWPAAAQA